MLKMNQLTIMSQNLARVVSVQIVVPVLYGGLRVRQKNERYSGDSIPIYFPFLELRILSPEFPPYEVSLS